LVLFLFLFLLLTFFHTCSSRTPFRPQHFLFINLCDICSFCHSFVRRLEPPWSAGRDGTLASFNKDAMSDTSASSRRTWRAKRKKRIRIMRYPLWVNGKRAYRRLREKKRHSTSLISCSSRLASAANGGGEIVEGRLQSRQTMAIGMPDRDSRGTLLPSST
jgi:hypothetical protein